MYKILGSILLCILSWPIGATSIAFQDFLSAPRASYLTLWGVGIAAVQPVCTSGSCILIHAQTSALPGHGENPALDKVQVQVLGNSGDTVNVAFGPSVVQYELTAGQVRTVPIGGNAQSAVTASGPGDQVLLLGGDYGNIEFRGKLGVDITCLLPAKCMVSQISAIKSSAITYAANDVGISNLSTQPSSSGVWMHFGKAGTKSSLRIVGNYAEGVGGASTGALLTLSQANLTSILGNTTLNTGVVGSNQAQDIYFGGKAVNSGLEIAYNDLKNHVGGRHIQIYGHACGERLSALEIHHNHVYNDISHTSGGNAGILVSHSDCQAGTNQSGDGWISDASVHHNTVHDIKSGDGIRYETSDLPSEPGVFAKTFGNTIFAVGDSSIEVNFAKGNDSSGNCLSKPIDWKGSKGSAYPVTAVGPYKSTNDLANYPVCLGPPPPPCECP